MNKDKKQIFCSISYANFVLYPDESYRLTNWKGFAMEEHSHSFFEVNYVSNGQCCYAIQDQVIHVRKKDLLIIDSRIPHKLLFIDKCKEDPCTVIGCSFGFKKQENEFISIEKLTANSDFRHFANDFSNYKIYKNSQALESTLDYIITEYQNKNNSDPIYMNILISKLLIDISRLSKRRDSFSSEHIINVQKYIQRNYPFIQSIKDIADEVNLNKTYLQRHFKAHVGCTLWQYVTNIRMQRAAALLRRTDICIGDIDEHIGLHSRHNFYLLFKKTYGISPQKYRKSYKKTSH